MRSAAQPSMVQHPRPNGSYMTDRMPNAFATGETTASAAPSAASEIEAATRRLTATLDALKNTVERRREYDRGSDKKTTHNQSLGVDRSRLANELDGTLVRSR